MMGPQHRILGALCGALVAVIEPAPTVAGFTLPHLPVMLATAAVATVTASGQKFSPDLDQSDWWRDAAKRHAVTYDRRDGKPSGIWAHRYGITHWFGWPLAAGVGLAWLLLVVGVPTSLLLIPVGLWVGWASHLVGDWMFGRLSLAPWSTREGRKFGLGWKGKSGKWHGLDTDGFAEHYPVRWGLIAALALVFWQFGLT